MRSKKVLASFTAILISAIGQGLVLSYLLVYLHDARHINLAVAGLIIAVAGVAGLTFASVGGALTDRFGSLTTYIGGLGVAALGAGALALARSPLSALLAVALEGVGNAVAWPAQYSLITVIVPPEQRRRAYALQFTMINAGIGIGALVSGEVITLTDPQTYTTVYFAFAVALIIAIIVISLGFAGTRGEVAPVANKEPKTAHPRGYKDVLSDPAFRRYLKFSFLLLIFGYGPLDAGWTAYATSYAGASPKVVGAAFATNTFVIVAAQLTVVKLVDRLRRSTALTLTAAGWAVAWLVSGIAAIPDFRGVTADILLAVSLGIFGLAETVYAPVASNLVNDLAANDLRGRYNALASSAWSVATLVSPPVAGILLGLGTPLPWLGVIVGGCTSMTLYARRLRKGLPQSVESPPSRGPLASS